MTRHPKALSKHWKTLRAHEPELVAALFSVDEVDDEFEMSESPEDAVVRHLEEEFFAEHEPPLPELELYAYAPVQVSGDLVDDLCYEVVAQIRDLVSDREDIWTDGLTQEQPGASEVLEKRIRVALQEYADALLPSKLEAVAMRAVPPAEVEEIMRLHAPESFDED